MSPTDSDAILALGKEPISAAAPAGETARYDEAFLALQGQMDRIGSLSGLEVEWKQVVELASGLLKTRSKDLLIMTYLTLGLLETGGFGGLAAGLAAYRELIAAYWESCFPKAKPPQGRINAIQYLAEKVLAQIEPQDGRGKRTPTGGERAAVHAAADAMIALDQAISTAYAGQADSPNVAPLVRAMKSLRERVGPLNAPAAETLEGQAAPGSGGTSAAPAAMAGGAPAAIPEVFRTATQALQAVKSVARFLLSQDDKDPTGYRLARIAAFGPLTEAPKDRLLPGPTPQRRQFFDNLAGSGDWKQLAAEAEGQFVTTPLWLDMQRYVALGLKGLGAAHTAAHDAVLLDAVALQRRLPGLFELSFKDGTPFADGGTRSWLTQAAAAFGGGGSSAGPAADSDDSVAKATAEARKLLAEAKTGEAVERLSSAIDAARGRRERYRAQLALSGLCLDMGRLSLGASLLEGLESVIDAYKLEEWEPELAAETLYDLYECMSKSNPKPTPEQHQRLHAIFARVARLDPKAAMKLEAAKKPG
ncbi:MAG: type VI secretion system protein TssA [Planctomycetes bacterium]|nr:type VI secretion system protein TssA [Planctomycetota bacterium]